jgi:MerR family copper efflux transcriptional regulator
MIQALLKIGEVAARAGVSVRTVDYYTGLGLISPAARSDGSFRLYDPAVIERIATIRQLESLGVGLDTITTALANPHHGDFAALIGRLDQDLRTLKATADTAAVDDFGLLVTAITRAHNLIAAALDIAASPLPGP